MLELFDECHVHLDNLMRQGVFVMRLKCEISRSRHSIFEVLGRNFGIGRFFLSKNEQLGLEKALQVASKNHYFYLVEARSQCYQLLRVGEEDVDA